MGDDADNMDFYSNNFLDLSLKNSIIKGLYQRNFDINSSKIKIHESFQTKYLLGKLQKF